MGSMWKKVKMALGFSTCLTPIRLAGESGTVKGESADDGSTSNAKRRNKAVMDSDGVVKRSPSGPRHRSPSPRSPSSSGLFSKSSKGQKSCAICLATLKAGHGHAIFTAECSHTFHFRCIATSVKHGIQVCPICRAKWKEIPFQASVTDPKPELRSRSRSLPREDEWMTVVRRLGTVQPDYRRQVEPPSPVDEPRAFDDDEELSPSDHIKTSSDGSVGMIDVKVVPEFSSVERSRSHDNFAVLIHIKAPACDRRESFRGSTHGGSDELTRASLDLITVLDVSGSMAGTKLALLKRAMGFVIQNLAASDRLSVVVFSSVARRIFPLRRMTEAGKQEALLAVNSLKATGGTNIAAALRKGVKLITDRKWKNPIASIILLSDGQDTFKMNISNGSHRLCEYKSLVPESLHKNRDSSIHIPVHTFGFGSDHDAPAMHTIAELSGGTFSFIEAQDTIQDAFAQCIGGLLSVVVQQLQVKVELLNPRVRLTSLQAGIYKTSLSSNWKKGSVGLGDLYAEEERDILLTVNIPMDPSSKSMSLLKVECSYHDPLTKQTLNVQAGDGLKLLRPEFADKQAVSIEVDTQRNRLSATDAMADARRAAEKGDLSLASHILESCYMALLASASWQAGDRLCVSLCAEVKEMKERMASRQLYEASGRAFMLSGISSHSSQRATARGDFSDTSVVLSYQTPSMVDMVALSQTMVAKSSSKGQLRPSLSFPATNGQHK